MRRGTKTVRGKFVDDMKNGRVKSRFVAAEVVRDVRFDVHAGTPALKALVSFAAMRDGKQRPRSVAFYDIVAAFVHASIDKVVAPSCGCHGDDFMAEGDDLPTGLDQIMMTEFEAKLLGRVGRGHLSVIKFTKRTLRWHDDEMCFSWSGTRTFNRT